MNFESSNSNIRRMFFNTKIKWTIDSERSEIFFRTQYLLLTGVNDIAKNIRYYNISQSEMCVTN